MVKSKANLEEEEEKKKDKSRAHLNHARPPPTAQSILGNLTYV